MPLELDSRRSKRKELRKRDRFFTYNTFNFLNFRQAMGTVQSIQCRNTIPQGVSIVARQKRSSVILQKSETRLAALQSINSRLDLGNGLTVAVFSALIETLRSQLAAYNSALSALDDLSSEIKQLEHQLRALSEQMLLGVAAKYGKDSREYGMAGGVRRSQRRRPSRKKKTESGSSPSQLLVIPPSPTGKGSESTNGNGNGKVTVS